MRATSAGTGARQVFHEPTKERAGARHRRALGMPEAPATKLRVSGGARRAGTIAFEAQRIRGTTFDVLLPKLEGASLSEWATKLAGQHAFHDQTRALEELARVEMSPEAAEKEDWRPTIGVLVSEPEAMFGLTRPTAAVRAPHEHFSTRMVIETIRELGGRPVLIPPRSDVYLPHGRNARANAIRDMLAHVDGVAGPGGADVHPRIYKKKITHSVRTNYSRDRIEADIALAAMHADVFMLGICRSHQLWNAASGGELIQDLRKEGYATLSQNQDDYPGMYEDDQPFVLRNERGDVVFENRVQVSGRLREIFGGREDVLTNSYHHQAVKKPGEGFTVTGVMHDPTTGKDTIEATEAPNAITVQWHPESCTKTSAHDRELIATLIRRSYVFKLVKQTRADGEEPTIRGLIERVKKEGRFELSAADDKWMRADLAKHLAATRR